MFINKERRISWALQKRLNGLNLLGRRYIGWVTCSFALVFFVYITSVFFLLTPNTINLLLAVFILLIHPVLQHLSKKVLGIKVINIRDGQPAGFTGSFLRSLLFFIPPFNLIDCSTVFLMPWLGTGIRLGELATDTRVVLAHTFADEVRQSEPKKMYVWIGLAKILYLPTAPIIFLVFYYQIIALGIQDIEALHKDSHQVVDSSEGIKILSPKGILSLGILEVEIDHRNKYQRLIGEFKKSGDIRGFAAFSQNELSQILRVLENEDQGVKEKFCEYFLNNQEALLEVLKYKNVEIRGAGALALGKKFGMFNGEFEEAVPALIQALKDGDEYVRRSVARAFSQIGSKAVPALIQALKDGDSDVRQNAAWALGQIGPEAKAAVLALIQALKDGDSDVRLNAAEALGRIGPEAKAAVLALIQALKDGDSDVRLNAAEALGQIGPEAKAAVPALIQSLKDEKQAVRLNVAAAVALEQINIEAEAIEDAEFDF